MSNERTARFDPVRAGIIAGLFVVALVLLRLLYRLMEHQGVAMSGDEPSYVMLSQALRHGTLHIFDVIQYDLAHRVFGRTYPPNATIAAVERYSGPAGLVSPFQPGLSLLLLPFVTVFGAVQGALLGIIAINTAGFFWLHQRISRLFSLDLLAQAVLAVACALPAILLATNQIYPDLPAGILIAIGCVEIAAIEVTKRVSRVSIAVVTLTVSYLPWLQPKNLVPAVVLLVGFAVVVLLRRPVRIVEVGVAAAVILVSFIGFFAFNQHYYGHWLGLPEPPVRLTRYGVELVLGLLFDKHQGLFVQVPWALAGLAGLVILGWRRLPVALGASLLSFAAILILNGTYTANAYGGGSFAGRFMWTLIPISLPWIGLILARAREAGRSLIAPLVIVVVAVVYQAQPVLTNRHDYYNAVNIHYPTWPTWWRGLLHVLPQFGRYGRTAPDMHTFGSPTWALPLFLVASVVTVAAVMVWATGRGGPDRVAPDGVAPDRRERRPIGQHARR